MGAASEKLTEQHDQVLAVLAKRKRLCKSHDLRTDRRKAPPWSG